MIITNNGHMIDQDIQSDFPVKIRRAQYHEQGPILKSHWHEEFMIFYIKQGQAIIYCNSKSIPVGAGDLIVINSNDIHYMENLCSELIEYYYIIINFAFLLSKQEDLCQTKYINPLIQQRIRFENQIKNDNELLHQVEELIDEYQQQNQGYELLIKADLYHIIVLLMRRHIMPIAEEENKRQYNILHQLRPVLEYIDQHYTQKLTLAEISTMANMSRHHFCRLFKSITGKPPIDYINHLRINAAIELLKEGHLNISEIAMTVGFNDSNYFSRLFKKYKNCSPTSIQKK
ncbi:AraC-like DNA-binding protein [Sporomusaceae bacterium BoRhaA]|uniref:AraC family transcriptional regulator n=1 Tax=Pelorhabdus rhamnosifermentans TaxID=2772457 RepID=UPI001C05F5EB|nr:AraC family transcriptional regulator [Pelorhabdus rhamnosifermentans]MBU2700735.1 AraC-like DNA-binding protein [Pelorhabdus rhamnosifermentans]